MHQGTVTKGSFTIGQEVLACVDKDREACKKNHTATHLLQWALQNVLGDSVSQQGSLVCPDYLRFDFTYPKSLTDEQSRNVEKLVNEKIAHSLPVSCKVMPIDEAKKLGAMALFGEKYGEEVRVVGIGAHTQDEITQAFSREFCGGTHIDNVGKIGGFKIVKEESVSAGVRRITALTGTALNAYLQERGSIVDQLCSLMKVPADQLTDRIEKILAENKELTKKLKAAHKQGGSEVMVKAKELLDNADSAGESKIIVGELPEAPLDDLRSAMDMLKKKADSSVIVIGAKDQDKVVLLVGVTDDLVKKGFKAGDIVKQIAPIVGGGGGGKPQMAQAGGKDPSKLGECLAKAKEIIKAAF